MRSLCGWCLLFSLPPIPAFFPLLLALPIAHFHVHGVVDCHCLKCDFFSLFVCLSLQFGLHCVTALSCYVNVSDKLISFPRSIHLIIFFVVVVVVLSTLHTKLIWMHIYERFVRWWGFYYYFIGVFHVYACEWLRASWFSCYILFQTVLFSLHLCK